MSGIKYKTSFEDIWLTDDQYKLWLQKDADIYSAKCKVCSKLFSVVGQGRKALDTHAKGLKHQQCLPNHKSTLKQHLQQDKREIDQAAALNKHPFSLLWKMRQQKKLR